MVAHGSTITGLTWAFAEDARRWLSDQVGCYPFNESGNSSRDNRILLTSCG